MLGLDLSSTFWVLEKEVGEDSTGGNPEAGRLGQVGSDRLRLILTAKLRCCDSLAARDH